MGELPACRLWSGCAVVPRLPPAALVTTALFSEARPTAAAPRNHSRGLAHQHDPTPSLFLTYLLLPLRSLAATYFFPPVSLPPPPFPPHFLRMSGAMEGVKAARPLHSPPPSTATAGVDIPMQGMTTPAAVPAAVPAAAAPPPPPVNLDGAITAARRSLRRVHQSLRGALVASASATIGGGGGNGSVSGGGGRMGAARGRGGGGGGDGRLPARSPSTVAAVAELQQALADLAAATAAALNATAAKRAAAEVEAQETVAAAAAEAEAVALARGGGRGAMVPLSPPRLPLPTRRRPRGSQAGTAGGEPLMAAATVRCLCHWRLVGG